MYICIRLSANLKNIKPLAQAQPSHSHLPHSPLKSEDVGELIIKHMACTYQNNFAQNQKSIYLSRILIRVCTVSFFQGWHVWAKVIFFSQGPKSLSVGATYLRYSA